MSHRFQGMTADRYKPRSQWSSSWNCMNTRWHREHWVRKREKERTWTHAGSGGKRDGSTVVLLVILYTVCLDVNPSIPHHWTNSSLLCKKSQWIWHWYLCSYEDDVAILWWNHLKQQDKIRLVQYKNKVHILIANVIKHLQRFSSNVMDSLSLRFQKLQLK